MQTIYFASNNDNKKKEIQRLLGPNYNVLSMKDLQLTDDVEETEPTYEGNALLKARHLSSLGFSPVLADDTGIEVQSLGGLPGVQSKRYYAEYGTQEQQLNQLLKEMSEASDNREAVYITVFILKTETEEIVFDNRMYCHMATDLRGTIGYMYDHLIMPKYELKPYSHLGHLPYDDTSQTYAEMSLTQRDELSPRSIGIKKVKHYFENLSQ